MDYFSVLLYYAAIMNVFSIAFSTGTLYASYFQNEFMETFGKIINDDKPVLVDFHAEWCGPCKMMASELKKFAQNNKETVRVLKVDIDKNQPTASHYNIQGVPTLILFKNGKVLWRQSGAMNAKQISDAVNPHL